MTPRARTLTSSILVCTWLSFSAACCTGPSETATPPPPAPDAQPIATEHDAQVAHDGGPAVVETDAWTPSPDPDAGDRPDGPAEATRPLLGINRASFADLSYLPSMIVERTYDMRSEFAGPVPFLSVFAGDVDTRTARRWSDYAAGRYDDELLAFADAIRPYGARAYLTFAHEPEDNLDDSPSGPGHDLKCGTESDYVAAFRHFHAFMRAHGVTAAIGPVWIGGRYADPDPLWPGDDVADFVGADVYEWNPGEQSLEERARVPLAFARSKRLPFVIPETNTTWTSSADSMRVAQWYRDIAGWVAREPTVALVCFFTGGDRHLRVDYDATVLAGFEEMARSPVWATR